MSLAIFNTSSTFQFLSAIAPKVAVVTEPVPWMVVSKLLHLSAEKMKYEYINPL